MMPDGGKAFRPVRFEMHAIMECLRNELQVSLDRLRRDFSSSFVQLRCQIEANAVKLQSQAMHSCGPALAPSPNRPEMGWEITQHQPQDAAFEGCSFMVAAPSHPSREVRPSRPSSAVANCRQSAAASRGETRRPRPASAVNTRCRPDHAESDLYSGTATEDKLGGYLDVSQILNELRVSLKNFDINPILLAIQAEGALTRDVTKAASRVGTCEVELGTIMKEVQESKAILQQISKTASRDLDLEPITKEVRESNNLLKEMGRIRPGDVDLDPIIKEVRQIKEIKREISKMGSRECDLDLALKELQEISAFCKEVCKKPTGEKACEPIMIEMREVCELLKETARALTGDGDIGTEIRKSKEDVLKEIRKKGACQVDLEPVLKEIAETRNFIQYIHFQSPIFKEVQESKDLLREACKRGSLNVDVNPLAESLASDVREVSGLIQKLVKRPSCERCFEPVVTETRDVNALLKTVANEFRESMRKSSGMELAGKLESVESMVMQATADIQEIQENSFATDEITKEIRDLMTSVRGIERDTAANATCWKEILAAFAGLRTDITREMSSKAPVHFDVDSKPNADGGLHAPGAKGAPATPTLKRDVSMCSVHSETAVGTTTAFAAKTAAQVACEKLACEEVAAVADTGNAVGENQGRDRDGDLLAVIQEVRDNQQCVMHALQERNRDIKDLAPVLQSIRENVTDVDYGAIFESINAHMRDIDFIPVVQALQSAVECSTQADASEAGWPDGTAGINANVQMPEGEPELLNPVGSQKRRVLVLNAGGSIGLQELDNGNLGHVSGAFAKTLRQISDLNTPRMPQCFYLELQLILGTSDLNPSDWSSIGRVIRDQYFNFDGFVVLHGIDTMAYTASALSFMLEQLGKPVVLTGSQMPIFEPVGGARSNLVGSIVFAGQTDINEVVIFYNGELLRGNRATKTKSSASQVFESRAYPALAKVEAQTAIFKRRLRDPCRGNFRLQEIDTAGVLVVWIVPGLADDLLEPLQNCGQLKGMVLQVYGTSFNQQFLRHLRRFTQKGVVVVIISQCTSSGIAVGGSGIMDCGVVGGQDMTVEAAVAKMSYLFSKGLSTHQVKKSIVEDLCGELTSEAMAFNINEPAFWITPL